ASLGEPEEVHPRREDRTTSRQDEGTDTLGNPVQFPQEGVEQLDVERARLPVGQPEGENASAWRTSATVIIMGTPPCGGPLAERRNPATGSRARDAETPRIRYSRGLVRRVAALEPLARPLLRTLGA